MPAVLLPPPAIDVLLPGQQILRNTKLSSLDKAYQLALQSDGNLVLTRMRDKKVLWSTGTSGTDVHRAVMQTDGNFVLMRLAGQPIWNSGTHGNPGSYLTLQNDGNLVIYRPQINALWHTDTWAR